MAADHRCPPNLDHFNQDHSDDGPVESALANLLDVLVEIASTKDKKEEDQRAVNTKI